MTLGSNFNLRSYAKTAAACLTLAAAALLVTVVGARGYAGVVSLVVVSLGAAAAFAATVFSVACIVVLLRYRRSVAGKEDLFLELNRSREPAAITGAAGPPTRARRWLARQLLGHELVVGDLVEVKTWAEISATLDERGCLEELPFMPEMQAMCGQHAHVFRCIHRLFDYRKSRRMRHMSGAVLLVGAVCDGSHHGRCEAACHTIWKAAWLRKVEGAQGMAARATRAERTDPRLEPACLQSSSSSPRYVCQLTQLHAASQPIGEWSLRNFPRPLIAGNVTLAAFVVGWLTYLFNALQHRRGGVSFPAFEPGAEDSGDSQTPQLVVGDQVIVKPSDEIRATLNDAMMNRGLWFDPEMMKHCGSRYGVYAEVTRLIDIVTGEMRTMKTPAYVLHGVHFSGERQLFNAQYEPLFWRGVWLRRAED